MELNKVFCFLTRSFKIPPIKINSYNVSGSVSTRNVAKDASRIKKLLNS